MEAARIQGGGGNRWRIIGWAGAAMLLLLPFVAMQFDSGVNWTASDFIFAAVLLGATGALLELGVRISHDPLFRGGFALALLGTFLVIWVNLAVGIVGSEQNPANLWFFGALLVGLAGALLARGKPSGMALAMFATAAALGVAFIIAQTGPTDEPFVPATREALGTGLFALLFIGSGVLFRKAAR